MSLLSIKLLNKLNSSGQMKICNIDIQFSGREGNMMSTLCALKERRVIPNSTIEEVGNENENRTSPSPNPRISPSPHQTKQKPKIQKLILPLFLNMLQSSEELEWMRRVMSKNKVQEGSTYQVDSLEE